ncbi:histidine phosphatase family protein, partial [Staphylococcus aureus]|nr:histidine phosphatase family protein [Staphylococcus aureus]
SMMAAKILIDWTLSRDIAEGKENLVFVGHGRVIEAIVMLWGHYDPADWKKLGKVGNGDIIEISGEPKHWTIRQIYDGVKGEGVNRL